MNPRYRRGRPPREPRGRRASFRLALTIAARTSIRSLGRSALIAVMVALPVAGLTATVVVFDSVSPTVDERIATQLAHTQARLNVVNPPTAGMKQDPLQPEWWTINGEATGGEKVSPAGVLPTGTRILALSTARVTAKTATGIAHFDVREGPSWDAAFAGMHDVIEGRTPRTDREVMVTASLLERLGLEVGESVELEPPAPRSVTVVGILDDQTVPDAAQRFFARDGALSGTTDNERLADATFGTAWQNSYYLPDTVLDWAAVQELNENGIVALSVDVLKDPPSGEAEVFTGDSAAFTNAAMIAVIAGFAAFEVILLAGAAFTVTARQQQRTLATIASVGAPRRLLFLVLTANGVVLGAVGGLIGIGLGLGAAGAYMSVTANGSATQYYGFHIPWLALLGFAGFAVLIGWIASLLPARNASRFDIVAALRGSRRPPVPSTRRPVIGLVMLILGVVLTLIGGVVMALLMEAGTGIAGGHPLLWMPIAMLIAGPVLAQLGLMLCGPLVLRVIARSMGRLGIGARLASRDAARNPSRAVPALAAIMSTIFVAVFAMSMMSSGQESTIRNHTYFTALGQVNVSLNYVEYGETTITVGRYENTRAVEDALRSTIDADQVRTLSSVADPMDFGPEVEAGNTVATEPQAVPAIPPTNRCPWSPDSPEHSEAMSDPASPEYRAANTDWRCQSNYVQSTFASLSHLWVGDAADLALVLDREPSAEAQRMLSSGGAVSLYPEYVHDGTFSIEWWSPKQITKRGLGKDMGVPLRSESMDAVVETPEHPFYFGVFVSPETADRLGLDYEESMVLASTTTMPTTAETDALAQAMQNLPDLPPDGLFYHLEKGPEPWATVWIWGLLALSGLIAIGSATVAIGLARFDGRQDDATLAALGARRMVRKSFAFWQAIVIVGVAAVLGAGMGLVPAVALAANPDIPFAAPWLQIGLTVIALPLLVACGSWLFATRSKVPARRMAIA